MSTTHPSTTIDNDFGKLSPVPVSTTSTSAVNAVATPSTPVEQKKNRTALLSMLKQTVQKIDNKVPTPTTPPSSMQFPQFQQLQSLHIPPPVSQTTSILQSSTPTSSSTAGAAHHDHPMTPSSAASSKAGRRSTTPGRPKTKRVQSFDTDDDFDQSVIPAGTPSGINADDEGDDNDDDYAEGSEKKPKRPRRQIKKVHHPYELESRGGKIGKIMQQCKKLLITLKNHKYSWPFLEPVDPISLNIPDYFDIVKSPMDLHTISDKLEQGSYTLATTFANDVRQVWANCRLYNQPGSDVVKMADALSVIFEDKFKKIEELEIQYQNEILQDVQQDNYTNDSIIDQQKLNNNNINNNNNEPDSPRSNSSNGTGGFNASSSGGKRGAGRPKIRKDGKERAKPGPKPRKEMDYNEKLQLGQNINQLSLEKLNGVLEIIQSRAPKTVEDQEEVEIDLAKLDDVTLRELEKYVKKNLPKEKKPRGAPPGRKKKIQNQPTETLAATSSSISDVNAEGSSSILEDQLNTNVQFKSEDNNNNLISTTTTIDENNLPDNLNAAIKEVPINFDQSTTSEKQINTTNEKGADSASETDSGSESDSETGSSESDSENEKKKKNNANNPKTLNQGT